MERRFLPADIVPVSLVKRAEGEQPKITGYASVSYDGTPATEYVLWDFKSERAVERVMPGAFTKALSRPDDVRGLFNHNPDLILGRTSAGTMTLAVDGKGLRYDIVPGNRSVDRDVVESLSRKDVTGSSFSFVADEERWMETKDESGKWHVVREILSVTLWDVGPVTFPAYGSTTAGARAISDDDEARKSYARHCDQRKSDGDDAAKLIAAQRDALDMDIRLAEIGL